jgi:hypothetical protein
MKWHVNQNQCSVMNLVDSEVPEMMVEINPVQKNDRKRIALPMHAMNSYVSNAGANEFCLSC